MKAFGTIIAILVGFSPIIGFTLLFNWLRRSAKAVNPRENGSAVEFFLSPRIRILLQVVVTALIAFTLLVIEQTLTTRGSLIAVVVPLAVLGAMLMAIPRTVIVDAEGIRQHRLLRIDRQIAWNDIAWMRRGANSGTTYVKSKNGGRPVSFSPLLVGQSRFEKEVRARAQGGADLCTGFHKKRNMTKAVAVRGVKHQ